MKLFPRLRAGLRRTFSNAVIRTSQELAEYFRQGSGAETVSGAVVTNETAMRVSAVYACVRVLSEDIAALPLNLYRRTDRGRERVRDHWANRLLKNPNRWQTGFEFREMETAHLELGGAFFALKTVVRNEVRELIPLAPWRVHLKLDPDGGRLRYFLNWPDDSGPNEIPADRIYHVRGLTLDGFTPVSPIAYHRETVGLAIQQLQYGARLYKNGAMIGGVLKHPGVLSEEASKRLTDSFDEKYAGAANAWKTVLLEEGMEFVASGMKADEAQWIESRQFMRSEIAGIYRVPPHLIGDLSRATFSNIEEQSRNYVMYGLLPRLRRRELRMNQALFGPDEDSLYVEYNVDGLLRGALTARMQAYQIAVSTGWMNRNEVRDLENLPPGPPELDEFLDPAFLTGNQPASASDTKEVKDA